MQILGRCSIVSSGGCPALGDSTLEVSGNGDTDLNMSYEVEARYTTSGSQPPFGSQGVRLVRPDLKWGL